MRLTVDDPDYRSSSYMLTSRLTQPKLGSKSSSLSFSNLAACTYAGELDDYSMRLTVDDPEYRPSSYILTSRLTQPKLGSVDFSGESRCQERQHPA
jgi:hypothetical protein